MELLMTESHMYLLDIKSSPSLTVQNSIRSMSSIRLNLLTKTTWKLKTPGGILVCLVLVQVCLRPAAAGRGIPVAMTAIPLSGVGRFHCPPPHYSL